MAGALVHVFVGIFFAVVVHIVHFKLEFSLAIFIGSLLPDVIKFGITGFSQKNLNPCTVNIRSGPFRFLGGLTGSYNFWFTVGFFVLAMTLFLYHYHVINKKKMEEYDELYGFLLVGIIIHLILDSFVIETGCLI
jgi:hypothetical protein